MGLFMKQVILMSIHKKHSDNIGNSSKPAEGRKRLLPLNTWIYLIDTKNSGGDGKVHRRIMFEEVDTYEPNILREEHHLRAAQLLAITKEELSKYANGDSVIIHHISKVENFDKPMGLGEFYKINCDLEIASHAYNSCSFCIANGKEPSCGYLLCDEAYKEHCGEYKITRPPQSWRYAWIKEIEV